MPRDKIGHFYYSWYPTVFKADTQHLTPHEDGCYRRLIDEYMMTRSPLSSDDRALSRIVGVTLVEWTNVKTQLVSFFKTEGLFLRHTFCDEMLAADSQRISTAKRNGKSGGRPKSSETKTITQLVTNDKPSPNPVGSPRTKLNNTKQGKKTDGLDFKFILPDWVPRDLWSAWLEVRTKKGAPNTDTALDLSVKDLERLEKLGFSPRSVLEQSVQRGWQGLFVIKGDYASPTTKPVQPKSNVVTL